MTTTEILTNDLGAQAVFDGGNPRTFTATAREVISGAQLVNISGASNDVGSQISSFADGDLQVVGAIDPKLCNGMAINNAGSNELVTIATRGAYLCQAHGIVSGGALVQHNSSGGVTNLTILGSAAVASLGPRPIGTAMTTSASGANMFALVSLNI